MATTTTRQCEDVEEREEAVESDEDEEGEDLPETSGVSLYLFIFDTIITIIIAM